MRFIACTPKRLPPHLRIAAAMRAIEINPVNRPAGVHTPERLAMIVSKSWGPQGVNLSVEFLEETSNALANKILAYANKWNQAPQGPRANIKFFLSKTDPIIRVSRGPGGYFCYEGTDLLGIPINEQTMNLESFTLDTPDSEYDRVVPHEFGHAAGFPHEHSRAEVIALLAKRKVIRIYEREQQWSEQEIRDQVFTPPDPRDLIATKRADLGSVMGYAFDGRMTKSGQPIPGGLFINSLDYEFAASCYPMPGAPPPPIVVPPAPPVVSPPDADAWDLSLTDPVGRQWRGNLKLV